MSKWKIEFPEASVTAFPAVGAMSGRVLAVSAAYAAGLFGSGVKNDVAAWP
jgi:hypothetical protein